MLVATDVLSEGQNLQDSHIIVNYDLPWAIIRIIQRAGRVDRVGQKSDTVYIYLITHEKIEQQIRLRQRIKARLGAAAAAFGSDEQFFGGEQEIKILDDFYNGRVTDDADDAEGEADAVSEAWLVWSNAQNKHPKVAAKVLTMQDMVAQHPRPIPAREPRQRYVLRLNGLRHRRLRNCYDYARRRRSSSCSPRSKRSASSAPDPDTPTAPLRGDHFDREKALVQGPLKTETVAAGNLKGVRKWAWQRLGGTVFGEAAADALSALYERPLTEYATMRLTQARRNRYSLDDLADLIAQLHDEDRLVIRSTDTDTIKIVCSLGVQEA